VSPVDAVTGVRLSLWRAAVVYRVIAAIICCYLVFRWRNLYAQLPVAVAVAVAIVLVTGAVAYFGLAGRAHRAWLVGADLTITIVLTLLSIPAQTAGQAHGGMTTLTTVWAAGPVIEAGLVLGSLAGIAAGALQFGVALLVRAGYDGHTVSNGVLLLIVGGISGYLMSWTSQAEAERAQLAVLAERERLARSIHDGVLQVLALVHRKAADAGRDWAELGQAAAEQEAALRGLITSSPIGDSPIAATASESRDLVAELTLLRADRITVAVPGHSIPLDASRTAELIAVVRAALHNVGEHAGPGARAWVLAEQVRDEVWLTVRDDGCGVSEQRLAEAREAGRLGVAASIRGRVADLGGTVRITSAPGAGTELEIVVPAGNGNTSRSKNR
jgi:signal transduction histidine kinase